MSLSASREFTNVRIAPTTGWNLALWWMQGVLALAFAGAGAGKLAGLPELVALYDTIGVGQWLRYATGVLELTGAGLIVAPKTSVVGAGILGSILVGAVAAHVFILHSAPGAALALIALSVVVLWGRWAERGTQYKDLRPSRHDPAAIGSN